MSASGPTGPDHPSGEERQAPGGGWTPPSAPIQQPTQAVPDYTPPSHGQFQTSQFDQPQGNVRPGPSQRAGGQRALVAGVLGGLVTLAAITAGFLFFGSNDDPDIVEPQPLANPASTEPGEPDERTTEDRVGTSVTGLGLLDGDCINYDQNAVDIESFDIVTCTTPHLGEIGAILDHPEPTAVFPGLVELYSWSVTTCREATTSYLGTEIIATTLDSVTLLPDEEEWNDGLTSVSCVIQSSDGSRLIEGLEGRGSSYPRETEVAINDLRVGDCFLPQPPLGAFDLRADDIVDLANCDGAHDGLFFGRGDLSAAASAPYPGADEVDADSIVICDAAFSQYFGVLSDGLNYRFWTPGELQWNNGERTVHCSIIDEAGLPTVFNFAAFQRMAELPIGSCFVFGPEETVELLRIDDRVEPVDCAQPHNGELFGLDELPVTSDPFPGDDALDQQVQQLCIDLFTDYVGRSPLESVSGDFRYWYPSRTGWETNDLRWACALVIDDKQSGSIEGTGV